MLDVAITRLRALGAESRPAPDRLHDRPAGGRRVDPASSAGAPESGSGLQRGAGPCDVHRRPAPEPPRSRWPEEKQRLLDTLASFDFPIEVEVLQEGDTTGSSEDDLRSPGPLAAAIAEGEKERRRASSSAEACSRRAGTRSDDIPAYAYGPGRLDLAHPAEEQVEVEALLRAALVYARTIEHSSSGAEESESPRRLSGSPPGPSTLAEGSASSEGQARR